MEPVCLSIYSLSKQSLLLQLLPVISCLSLGQHFGLPALEIAIYLVAKPFQCGTWKYTKGEETYLGLWSSANPLQNALGNKRLVNCHTANKTNSFHIQVKNFCVALSLTLRYIHHIPALATGPEKIHFCGLSVGEFCGRILPVES